MTYENLLLSEENQILLLTFNREKALNALNARTMQELNHLFAVDLPQRTHLKGIVLTGAGERAFVAGADIKEFLELGGKGADMAQYGQDTFFLIERFPKPVIAAVNGFALGGGCELAMACHLRVAGEKARFGQPEVNLGIIPGYGGTQRLTQLIGKSKALEFCMTAEMIDAPEAYRLGLVNYVVPAGEEVNMAKSLLEKIASKGPVAIAKVIESVNAYFEDGVDGFAFEIKAFGETTQTADFHEGASAFVEKRAAQFKGK
jgi:enoyl-CoA hydratase